MPQRTCSIDGCGRKHVAKGLCGTHYNKARYTSAQRHPKITIACGYCGEPCQKRKDEKRFEARFCSLACRDQWRSAMTPVKRPRTVSKLPVDHPVRVNIRADASARQMSPLRRAVESNDYPAMLAAIRADCALTDTGCWEWQRKLTDGYAVVRLGGKQHSVHRLSLEARYRAPLGDQAAHHTCANTKCVNPKHLQPVTARENTAEMLARTYMESRIANLKAALRLAAPDHPLLREIGVVSAA